MLRMNGWRRRAVRWPYLVSLCFAGCTDDASDTANDAGTSLQEAGLATPSATNGPTNAEPTATETEESAPLFGGATEIEVPLEPEAGTTEVEAPLLQCTPVGGADATKLIDDFEGTDDVVIATGDGFLFSVKDESSGSFDFGIEALPEARGDSLQATHASGSMNSEWGATFGVAWNACVFDASSFRGIRFWARGNDIPFRPHIATPGTVAVTEGGACDVEGACWDDYTVTLQATPEWQEYFVPFDILEQVGWGLDAGPFDPSLIFSVQFQIDANVQFDLWLDDLSFYTDEDRELAEALHDAGAPDASAGPVDGSAADGGAGDASAPSGETPTAPSQDDAGARDAAVSDAGTAQDASASGSADAGLDAAP